MGAVDVDVKDFKDFFSAMGEAGKALKAEMEIWLDAIGNEFLKNVQNEIIRRNVMDSRLLLHSFEKNNENGIWDMTEDSDGITLTVGSGVDYAAYVNDGHWTIDPTKNWHFTLPDGTLARFVPGVWEGERFLYQPGAKTGMVVKQRWVNAKPYFDAAVLIMDKKFQASLEKKMAEWIGRYF